MVCDTFETNITIGCDPFWSLKIEWRVLECVNQMRTIITTKKQKQKPALSLYLFCLPYLLHWYLFEYSSVFNDYPLYDIQSMCVI